MCVTLENGALWSLQILTGQKITHSHTNIDYSRQLRSNLTKEKLEAEQQSQRMEFVLQQERQKADQKRIEAEGIRDAQAIISEGLNANVLQFKSIEAFMELAKSPNAKIIVTDGDLPMMMDAQELPSTNVNSRNIKLKN